MEDISNRTLALLLIIALVISFGGTIVSLNRLSKISLPGIVPTTGRGTTEYGSTNITVLNALSIRLVENSVDFGVGRVNETTTCANQGFANMVSGNSAYDDEGDCWIESTGGSPTTGFIVENDGNINASVSIRGPTNAHFFESYSGSNPYGLWWRANASDNGCAGSRNDSVYIQFDQNETLCTNVMWDGTVNDDTLAVMVNLTIPKDLPDGDYENTSITFYAIAAS
ncbi:hypothetical protein JW930_07360 [Candidatus Woesearchaeota archaeon]|nr:hypothetical protein [Candidatus Woesearchaeota archaeon]